MLAQAADDISMELAPTSVARTANGAITIGAAAAGTLDLRTPSGSIQVGVADGTSVLIDATSKFGRIEQRLDAMDRPAATDRRAEVRAHTSMGNVVIHRA